MLDILKKNSRTSIKKWNSITGKNVLSVQVKNAILPHGELFFKKKIGILTNKGNLLTLNNLL